MIHLFGECELDEARYELRRHGAVVRLEPKTFDVLAYLVRAGDRLVSKDELLDAVWAGQVVSESVLPKCVAAARRAVGDARTRPTVIQTVHGRGYRFVAPVQTRAATTAGGAPAATPFVGGRDAMATLRAALDAAQAGQARLVLLVGEPGIGKTRTAEELAAEARRRAARVLIGRAHESEGAPAFWPWLQALRGALPSRAASGRALELDGLIGAQRDAPARREATRDAEQTRFRLFDAVTAHLRRLGEAQPLVVVLDDLHWADEASLRLLGFAARELAGSRVLMLATYRDVELRRGHPLADLLATLAGLPGCERVALRGFDRADTERLIAAVSGVAPPEEVCAAVHDLTEGNPFFIQELVRLLATNGGLDGGAPVGPLALPQSVRDAIGRRLDALPAPCNALLRVAAVVGRAFDAPLLARLTGLDTATVLERLAPAVDAGVLDDVADVPGRCRFHHSLTRQTLYDELSTPERVRLHGQVGTALAAVHEGDATLLDELAHHFFQSAPGGEHERAIAACLRAAEHARPQLGYEQSAAHYERALQLCELYGAADRARRAELLLALGAAHALAGARQRARAAFQRAASLARELGRPDLLARAALGDRGAGEMGAPVEAATLALLDEAGAVLGDDAPALRARLLARLVGTPPHSDSMASRERLSRAALALARQSGDGVALRDALSARLWASLGPDQLDARLAIARELLALSERERDPDTALLAHEVELGVHLLRGELTSADHALAAYTRVAEDLRQPAWLFLATFIAGSRALAAGDLDRAEQLFRAAQARGRGTVPYAHFMCAAQLYSLRYMRGEPEDPELSALFFGEMMALPYSWAPAMRSALAFSLCLRGEREAGRREFAAVVANGLDTIRRDEHWLVTLGTLSGVAALLADRAAAAQLYDLLLPYAHLVLVHDLLRSVNGTVAATLGSLATVLGRYEEGERHYQQAEAMAAAMGGLTAVMDRPGYVHLLLSRDRPGDREHAREVLDTLRHEMARLGVRRSWQLTAIEQLGLAPDAASARPTKAPPIPTKPPRNRQDSGPR